MLLHDARRDARLDAAGISLFWKSKIAAGGIMHRSPRHCRWSRKPFAAALVLMRCKPPSPLSIVVPRSLRNELASDCAALRSSRALAAVSRRLVKPCGRGGDGGRTSAALAIVDALAAAGDLENYHLLHATRADLLRRIGSPEEAAKSYKRALALATNESERRSSSDVSAKFSHQLFNWNRVVQSDPSLVLLRIFIADHHSADHHRMNRNSMDRAPKQFSPSADFGLRPGILSPMETLAQSVSTWPHHYARSDHTAGLRAGRQRNWLAYLLATVAVLLVALCISRYGPHSSSPGSLYATPR